MPESKKVIPITKRKTYYLSTLLDLALTDIKECDRRVEKIIKPPTGNCANTVRDCQAFDLGFLVGLILCRCNGFEQAIVGVKKRLQNPGNFNIGDTDYSKWSLKKGSLIDQDFEDELSKN